MPQPPKKLPTALLLAVFLTGCSWVETDRCYLAREKYDAAKAVFLETGSWQSVDQYTESQGWADCERRQLHYALAKDLHLEDLEAELLAAQ